MNKKLKIVISIFAGFETVFSLLSPLLIILMWSVLFGLNNHWGNWIIYTIGLSASLFRAIRIGWLK